MRGLKSIKRTISVIHDLCDELVINRILTQENPRSDFLLGFSYWNKHRQLYKSSRFCPTFAESYPSIHLKLPQNRRERTLFF